MSVKLTPREPNAYVHKEYPKWVTPPGGKPRIVRDRLEEDEVMGTAAPVAAEAVSVEIPDSPAAVEAVEVPNADPPADDRDALLAQAAALGIKTDGRWSVNRLKSEIAAAQK